MPQLRARDCSSLLHSFQRLPGSRNLRTGPAQGGAEVWRGDVTWPRTHSPLWGKADWSTGLPADAPFLFRSVLCPPSLSNAWHRAPETGREAGGFRRGSPGARHSGSTSRTEGVPIWVYPPSGLQTLGVLSRSQWLLHGRRGRTSWSRFVEISGCQPRLGGALG